MERHFHRQRSILNQRHNPTGLQSLVSKYFSIPRIFKRLKIDRGEMHILCIYPHFRSGLRGPYYLSGPGGIYIVVTSGECHRLTHLVLFGGANSTGVKLEGEDQVKLKYLVAAITASRSSRKSTYVTWPRFFMRETAAAPISWSKPSWPIGSSCMSCSTDQKMGQPVRLPLGNPDSQRREILFGSLVPRIPLRKARRLRRKYPPKRRVNMMWSRIRTPALYRCSYRRFHVIAPKLMLFPAMVTEEVMDSQRKTKSSGSGKPRAWRWLNVKPLANESQINVLADKKNFSYRPLLSLEIWGSQ